MKKILFTTFAIVLFSTIVSYSQKNFINGLVITSKKDTLQGLINYLDWDKSPNSIQFKKSNSSPEIKFDVNQISQFIIKSTNETYVSKKFEVEKLSRDLGNSQFEYISSYLNRTKVIGTKNVFVKVLSSGSISLYDFIDSDKEEHFIVEHGTVIEPLVYHIVTIDKTQQRIFNHFQNQLLNIMSNNCLKISAESIKKYTYSSSSLQTLFRAYNGCVSNEKMKSTAINKPKNEFGVLTGLGISNFSSHYTTNIRTPYKSTNYLYPIIGVYYTINLPKNRGRVSIVNELTNYRINSNFTPYFDVNYNYNLHYIGLKNLLRFKILSNTPSLLLLTGISNGFIIKNSSTYQYHSITQPYVDAENFRKHEVGIVFGIGSTFNQFSIEARYTKTTGFESNLYSSNSNSNYIEAILRYNLNKK